MGKLLNEFLEKQHKQKSARSPKRILGEGSEVNPKGRHERIPERVVRYFLEEL